MKKLNKTEAELKKSAAYKRKVEKRVIIEPVIIKSEVATSLSLEKSILKNFANFIGNHLCYSKVSF